MKWHRKDKICEIPYIPFSTCEKKKNGLCSVSEHNGLPRILCDVNLSRAHLRMMLHELMSISSSGCKVLSCATFLFLLWTGCCFYVAPSLCIHPKTPPILWCLFQFPNGMTECSGKILNWCEFSRKICTKNNSIFDIEQKEYQLQFIRIKC